MFEISLFDPVRGNILTIAPHRRILFPKGNRMPLPKETDAARLLREMRERDSVFKMLDPNGSLKHLRSPLGDIKTTIDKLTQPPLQEVMRKIQDVPGQRALELARQLSRPAAVTDETRKETRPPATLAIRTVSELGPMIRKARKAMKLNQTEFAAHAGVGRRFISELEGGKGSLEFDKVVACALAAGIDISARSRSA